MRENIGFTVMAIGVIFDLVGCIGLVRLPDVYNRLQASTKCVTLGMCLMLISVMILGGAAAGMKAFLVMLFILITAPTAAHALARASHRAGIKLWERSACDKLKDSQFQK